MTIFSTLTQGTQIYIIIMLSFLGLAALSTATLIITTALQKEESIMWKASAIIGFSASIIALIMFIVGWGLNLK